MQACCDSGKESCPDTSFNRGLTLNNIDAFICRKSTMTTASSNAIWQSPTSSTMQDASRAKESQADSKARQLLTCHGLHVVERQISLRTRLVYKIRTLCAFHIDMSACHSLAINSRDSKRAKPGSPLERHAALMLCPFGVTAKWFSLSPALPSSMLLLYFVGPMQIWLIAVKMPAVRH